MTDELERRWDDAMEEAWTGFRERLADRLAGLDERSLLVGLPDEELLGAAPYCQVMAEEGWLRVEAVSNEFLDEQHQLDGDQAIALVGLGFSEPEDGESPNFWLDLEQREADRAAWLVVHALRHVYAVLHPIYLEADGLEPDRVVENGPAVEEPDDTPRFPESSDELLAGLQVVLRELLGTEPVVDEDGDLVVPTEQTVFFVTIGTRMPRILVHATLVRDVVDEQRALVEVNLLNKAEFGLTFVLADGSVTVRRELPMTVLVPADVRLELGRLTSEADRWVSDLLTRVGGRAVVEDGDACSRTTVSRRCRRSEPDDERFRNALRVLRELEGEERGSVDPATMARIFHGDRDLLLARRPLVGRSCRTLGRATPQGGGGGQGRLGQGVPRAAALLPPAPRPDPSCPPQRRPGARHQAGAPGTALPLRRGRGGSMTRSIPADPKFASPAEREVWERLMARCRATRPWSPTTGSSSTASTTRPTSSSCSPTTASSCWRSRAGRSGTTAPGTRATT